MIQPGVLLYAKLEPATGGRNWPGTLYYWFLRRVVNQVLGGKTLTLDRGSARLAASKQLAPKRNPAIHAPLPNPNGRSRVRFWVNWETFFPAVFRWLLFNHMYLNRGILIRVFLNNFTLTNSHKFWEINYDSHSLCMYMGIEIITTMYVI